MKLYNTLTRKVEKVKPINKNSVTVYTCGPTVYDHAHIGHWFTYIRMDLLIRTLNLGRMNPKWVMNITDVGHLTSDADEGEDKLEKGAKREGKTAWQIASHYTDEFLNEMDLLNITKPQIIPRATDHISDQIALIKVLEDKGYTYQISDGIYYDTSKFKSYADFARLDVDDQIEGARVEINPDKKNKTDFALWKFSPKDRKRDMQWDSPWGVGFPGWHIECSAMAMKYLGSTLDIHCGGIDHIPVHHTNEIAQSEAATGKKFANLWMHSNHVLIDDQKISKSLGNGLTLPDLLSEGFSADEFRLLVLESSYMTQSKFSFDSMKAAKNRYQDIKALAVMRYQTDSKSKSNKSLINKTIKEINKALNNNLDTPNVLFHLSKLVKTILENGLNHKDLKNFINLIQFIDDSLGFNLSKLKDIKSEDYELIKLRQDARNDQDFARSDEIRSILEEKGIRLRDQETTQWYYF